MTAKQILKRFASHKKKKAKACNYSYTLEDSNRWQEEYLEAVLKRERKLCIKQYKLKHK